MQLVGITPWSTLIASNLIFWNLLTLQKSVMQAVKSANKPFATMSAKRSLFNRVTMSNAAVTTRSLARKVSLETFEVAEKTANMVLQPDRML